MRLLHTRDRVLVDKPFNSSLPYAILSHTWADDEVVFEDVQRGTISTKSAASQYKLAQACRQALEDGYTYIWIDTCCIDKSSSAELTESLNSMFAWYRDAAICYAFLTGCPDTVQTSEEKAAFAGCRWFTRGYTLQELIAPADIVFFSDNWTPVATKKTLSTLLANITGIEVDILLGNALLDSASIAKRMSWAAHRNTTKAEDMAYCLMGIFSVNMPLLYGEGGEKAFLRLQEEIMKQSDDHSLFAWVDLHPDPGSQHGLLAKSPTSFASSNGIIPYHDWEPRAPYSTSNRGLRIDLHLTPRSDNLYVAALDCPVPPDYQDGTFLAIYLQKVAESDQQFARVRVGTFASIKQRGALRTIFIRQTPKAAPETGVFPHHYLQLTTMSAPRDYRLQNVLFAKTQNDMDEDTRKGLATRYSARDWVPRQFPIVYEVLRQSRRLAAALIFIRDDGERLALLMGTCDGSSFDVAFDAKELSPGPRASEDGRNDDSNELANSGYREDNRGVFESLDETFEPSQAGRFDLEHHSVRISATPTVKGSSKYYIVSIGVESVKTEYRLTELVHEAYRAVAGTGHGTNGCGTPEEQTGKPEKASRWSRLVHRKDAKASKP